MAKGIYKPTTTTDRIFSFVMQAGVGIYGGFAGNETALAQRDWVTNTTTLSGDIGAAGNTDNSYHVVTSNGLDSAAVLDGFTISGGNATSCGGGMYNSSSSPTVTNCTFSRNITFNGGGGMYNDSSSPTITNCIFSGNSAGFTGGGMDNFSSSPTVTNCTFSKNTITEFTGIGGGGMYNFSSSPTVTNCTFSGNKAVRDAGGMYNTISSPTVTNCILWNNLAFEIFDNSSSTTTATYSIIRGGFTGTGNLNANPLFVDSSAGNFRLQGTSPAIDMGNSAVVIITTDLDGNPRMAGVTVDMGAYELPAPEINLKQGATNIASAGSYDFGSVAMGSDSGAITFTIENKGAAALSLSGTPKIAVSGADAADFSVDETSTTSPVAASGSTTFTVTFTPSSDVAKTATLTIANDDSDENPYTVTLTGTGTDGTTIPPVIPGPPLPIVITAEVSNITTTGAVSGGNVVYPEGCTALLVGRGVVWGTVSSPVYPQYSHTFDGWASGEYTSSLTNLVPQTKYYIRAYVMYKLNGVVYTRYSEYIYNFMTPALPGDVNGDKVLDLKDVILALKIVAGAAGNAVINLPADVNGDGKIGVEEAVYVLQNI